MYSRSARFPSAPSTIDRMPRPSPVAGCTIEAPAPSPNSTAVPRSVMSVTLESFSAPSASTVLALSGGDEALGDGEPVDPAGTRGGDIERRGVPGAEQRLEIAGGRGKPAIGADGAQDDRVDLLGGDAGLGHRAARRGVAETGERLPRPGDAALPDAGALHDPLVGGVEVRREIGVGHDPVGHRGAQPGDRGDRRGAHRRAAASRSANSAPMCLARSTSTDCTATRMA